MDQLDLLFKESNVFYNVIGFLITENEKLFERSDAKLYWRTVLHCFFIYHHAYVGLFAMSLGFELQSSPVLEIQMLFKFGTAYLTGWNFLFQTTFLFLALAHDVLEWVSKDESNIARKIKYWRDVIFAGMVVPYTCFVFTMFWSLYAIDRELVFPKVYDAVVPWWFNHCVHSNILALVAIETFLQPRRYPTDRRIVRLEVSLVFGVGVTYAIVYYSIYFFAGRWLYNVFGIMTWWQVCLFQLLIWTSSYLFYEIQWPINRLIHGQEQEPQKEEQKTEINERNGTADHNGEINNGETRNGEMKTEVKQLNGETKVNGETKNGVNVNTTNIDFKTPPFSTKSWSLKYRSLRNQFENSKL